MKHIETISTWNIFLEVIASLTSSVSLSSSATLAARPSSPPVPPNPYAQEAEDIESACISLAHYSVSGDLGHGLKSRSGLSAMEKSGAIAGSHIFVRLARHFYLAGVVEERETKWLCDLLMTLYAFLGNQYYFPADKNVIQQLLTLGVRYPVTYPHRPDEYDERMARSARYLKAQGFSLSVEMGTISFSDDTGQALFDLLERKIATIGGNTMFGKIMNRYLCNWYIPDIDRYIYGRKLDQERNDPFNLLLQLSAKHLKQVPDSPVTADTDGFADEIITLAEAMLDIHDIQGSSGMEYSVMGTEQFPVYLLNEMIFDKICVAPQYSARFVLLSLDYLIKPWFAHGKREYSYDDYYKVAELVLNFEGIRGFVNPDHLRKATGISRHRLKQILEDLSIPAKDVNREFTSLDGRINLFTRPVIRFPSEPYLFLEPRFCGIGFFHAACDIIRPNYPRLEREQGEAVERMLRDEMEKKGYGIKHGKYQEKNGMKPGECDLVLQNSRLTFMEVKKKSIEDELGVLDDVTVLENMTFGMVKAQKQCFFHENYIRSNGEIDFCDTRQKVVCKAGDIPAYKVSVCYPEYTFLTNKMFSMNLLEILLLGEFKAVDTSLQGKLDKLNLVGEEIRQCVVSQNQGQKISARDASFFSLFTSLQQVLTAVWWCENEEEFFQVLDGWIYSTDKTLDPYVSLIATKKMMIDSKEGTVRRSMMEWVKKRGTATMIVG